MGIDFEKDKVSYNSITKGSVDLLNRRSNKTLNHVAVVCRVFVKEDVAKLNNEIA